MINTTTTKTTIHIVSWNVASWSQTLNYIQIHHGSLSSWLEKHKIDILCLQEVKSTNSKIELEPRSVQALLDGWQSFWGCATCSSAIGFNGVATFCKNGTVCSADNKPFRNKEFDDEGRCIVTDHKTFLLFNVYIPTSRRLEYKLEFLKQLRLKIEEAIRNGREVILTGDLNISRRSSDVHWRFRILDIDEILSNDWINKEKEIDSIERDKKELTKSLVLQFWDKIKTLLGTVETSTQTIQTSSQKTIQKYRLSVKGKDGKSFFRKPYFNLEDANEDVIFYQMIANGKEAQCISVDAFVEAVTKVSGQSLSNNEIQILASFGRSCSYTSTVEWLESLISELGLIDSFAALYPDYLDRFTCWNQSTNRRYYNEGTRLDYFLLTPKLFSLCEKGELSTGGLLNSDPKSTLASHAAATANGLWQPAPFDGSGIIEGSKQAYESQFFEPHCGIIYTPPQFSDHVAISLLLKLSLPVQVLSQSKQTRSCQPHLAQRSITSFFCKGQSEISSSQIIVQQQEKMQETLINLENEEEEKEKEKEKLILKELDKKKIQKEEKNKEQDKQQQRGDKEDCAEIGTFEQNNNSAETLHGPFLNQNSSSKKNSFEPTSKSSIKSQSSSSGPTILNKSYSKQQQQQPLQRSKKPIAHGNQTLDNLFAKKRRLNIE